MITLSLEQRTVDYIVSVLAQRPYAEVAQAIQEIGKQMVQQQGMQDTITQLKGNGAAAPQQEASP